MPLQELHIDGCVDILQDRHAWVRMVLLAATGLTVLSTSTGTLPRSPMMQHLHLRHLELSISYDIELLQLESYLIDISCCPTLESLKIRDIDVVVEPDSEQLPSLHCHTMPRLKHVTLVDCLLIEALSLPAGCSLFLDGNCDVSCDDDNPPCHKHCQDFGNYTTVMLLTGNDTEWPLGIQGFSALNFFEYRIDDLVNQDLANLQHIPHVMVVSQDQYEAPGRCELVLYLTGGSWQTLEVFFFGELDLTINDVDSFVRNTRSFTFSSEEARRATSLFRKIQRACKRHGKACYVIDHKASWGSLQVTYVTLSTSKEVAEMFPIIHDDDRMKGRGIGFWGERTICHGQDFWPSDPCASVKQA